MTFQCMCTLAIMTSYSGRADSGLRSLSLANQLQDEENVTRVVNIRAKNTAKDHIQGWQRFIGEINARQ